MYNNNNLKQNWNKFVNICWRLVGHVLITISAVHQLYNVCALQTFLKFLPAHVYWEKVVAFIWSHLKDVFSQKLPVLGTFHKRFRFTFITCFLLITVMQLATKSRRNIQVWLLHNLVLRCILLRTVKYVVFISMPPVNNFHKCDQVI